MEAQRGRNGLATYGLWTALQRAAS